VIRVNLLPYREVRRKAQLRRDGIGAGLFLVLVVGLLGAAYLHMQREEERYRERVEYMETAMQKINDQLQEVQNIKEQRKQLLQKLEVVKELQEGRSLPVDLLQTLGQAVPKEVSLSSVAQGDNGLDLKGSARSNSDISSFMRRLEASPLYRDPDLKVITNEQRNGQTVKSFELAVTLVQGARAQPDSEADGQGSGEG